MDAVICSVINLSFTSEVLAIAPELGEEQGGFMTRRGITGFRRFAIVCGLLMLGSVSGRAGAEPPPAAVSAFNAYVSALESRLAQQQRSQNTFLAAVASEPQSDTRLRQGELIIEKLPPSSGADLPEAMLHHWRGTAFVPGAKAADFERLMKDFNDYPRVYSPQVVQARVLAQQ